MPIVRFVAQFMQEAHLLTFLHCVFIGCHKNLNIICTLVKYAPQTFKEEPLENVSLAV